MKRKMSSLTFILVLLLLTVVLIQLARSVGANPYFHGEPEFKEVLPPVGIEPPTISILNPENDTVYASSNITINFDVILTRDTNNDGIHDTNDDNHPTASIEFIIIQAGNQTSITLTFPATLLPITRSLQSIQLK